MMKDFPSSADLGLAVVVLTSFPFLFHAQATRARGVMSMTQSKALPFLKAPAKLDGSLAGDFGFDPMGISDQVGEDFGRSQGGKAVGREGADRDQWVTGESVSKPFGFARASIVN